MPKVSIDTDFALGAICEQIGDITIEQAAQNFPLFDHRVQTELDWNAVASKISISREKLYHWYRDTYRRKNLLQVTNQDKLEIERQVAIGVRQKLITTEFKHKLHDQFIKYDWSVFSVIFNNAKTKVQCRLNDGQQDQFDDLLLQILKASL